MCGAAAAGPANAGPIPRTKKSVPVQARFFCARDQLILPTGKMSFPPPRGLREDPNISSQTQYLEPSNTNFSAFSGVIFSAGMTTRFLLKSSFRASIAAL